METEATKSPTKKKLADTVTAKKLDRCFKIFELRKNGGSFRAISQTLKSQDIADGGSGRGYSHTQVKADYDFAVQVKIEGLGDMVNDARVLTAERIDDVFLRISPLMNDPAPTIKIAAANALLKASKEYAELFGAKKPTTVEVSGNVNVAMSLEDWKRSATERLKGAAESLANFDKTDEPEPSEQLTSPIEEAPAEPEQPTPIKTGGRTVIIGWPGTGKTTLAEKMGGGRSSDEVMDLGWSEASEAVSYWLDEPGPWLIEGVAVPRALRKWRERNPGQPPPVDKVIHLHQQHRQLKGRAVSMGKGIDKVLSEILPWLQSSVQIENVT